MMRRGSVVVSISVIAAACGGDLEVGLSSRSLDAFCEAEVRGIGVVDVEDDYLPHVIACENGSADDEALKAQAVAARTYLYYKLETSGSVADGQSDQVYSCSRAPGDRHFAAAQATAGEVLTYRDTVIASFFVAGAIPSTDDCVPLAGDRDPYDTEQWVTYNWGLSGGDVVQSPLGWVNAANLRNRGCQSQNGANCLSQHGWAYRDILAFYYGDAAIQLAAGTCITPPPPPPPPPPAPPPPAPPPVMELCGVVDEAVCSGDSRWSFDFLSGGDFAISVRAPSSQMIFRVMHGGAEDSVLVDPTDAEWAPLGVFAFAAGSEQWIEGAASGDVWIRRAGAAVDPPPVLKPPTQPKIEEEPERVPDPHVDGSAGCACVAGPRGVSLAALVPAMWVLLRRRRIV